MRILFFLLLPLFVVGQNTSAAVSDSILTQLDALGYDSLIDTHNSFYDSNGDLYVYFTQISGKQFRAISHTVAPAVFLFTDNTLTRAWHEYEIDNWLSGATGTNYEGYGFAGSPVITCTITISGDTWTGMALNNTDALGLAFYHFLLDPDFATYLQ